MSKGLVATIAFIFGAGAGSLVTYKVLKEKFAALAEADIQEIRDYYAEKNPEEEISASNEQEEAAERAREKVDIMEYAREISENRYANRNNIEEDFETGPINYIDENEVGEIEDYDVITLTYYSDGVLADDTDEEVENFIDKVGNFTTHFDGDVAYVRNDDYQAYYEIIRDNRTYVEVVGDEE